MTSADSRTDVALTAGYLLGMAHNDRPLTDEDRHWLRKASGFLVVFHNEMEGPKITLHPDVLTPEQPKKK